MDQLAVITTYFNPAGWKLPHANALRFVEYCHDSDVDLFVAEVSYDLDGFVLQSSDRCHVTRITADRDKHTLWQKERLLNLLIDSLPDQYTAVAWIDADIEFEHSDWPSLVLNGLQTHKVLQLFRTVWERLPAGYNWLIEKPSVASALHDGEPDFMDFRKWHPGFAWAARRETLTAIGGLMDNNITGGADSQMLGGFCGVDVFSDNIVSPAMIASMREWRGRCFQDVDGDVGLIDGDITHYWHGDRVDRQYTERMHWLSDFDPTADIEIDPETGLWQWTTLAIEKKHELVTNVTGYFYQRNEDGKSA